MLAYESTILPVILLLNRECLWLKSRTFGIKISKITKKMANQIKLGKVIARLE